MQQVRYLGRYVAEKSPESPERFSTSVMRRNLKKVRYEAEGAKEYREANKRIQTAVKNTKEDWIEYMPNVRRLKLT